MHRYHESSAQKTPLHPTSKADLAAQARAMTGKLSARVEEPVTEYVTRKRDSLSARARALQRAASEWKAFEVHDFFADGLSTR
ncbi:type II toxin-antitoxin system CcdA family antitoxin [Xanthomonas axonopodis pv. begoniae]|nr:type II toxin-antitoxin system CcdA family antitoxin [Xanthomonas axonopodis pv. begoniae]MBO9770891.1 type II toxin-antitoxin system CcdA family antitoxin [Xanthomonas axonopodis pv. begoniae]PPT39269.1 plasmid maintenance protein CcdB [Xanthomonas axonopodis pv. begoniae]